MKTWPTRITSLLPVFLAAIISITLGAGTVPPAAARASGNTQPRVSLPGSLAPAIAQRRAAYLGAYPQDAPLTVIISLRPRDPAGLDAFARAVSDPQSPLYRHYLTYAQVQQRYGPAPEAADAVVGWLRGHGINALSVGADSVSIRVPAGAAGALFGVQIDQWRLPDGRVFYGPARAPAIPAALAGAIAGVSGLDNEARLRPHLQPARGVADPRAVSPGKGPAGGYTPAELRAAYDTSGVVAGGTDGRGQTVDLYELEGYNPDNVAAYDSQYGLPTGTVLPISCALGVGGAYTCDNTAMAPAPGDVGGEVEVESDIEVIRAMAPGATIHVWQTPNDDADSLELWKKMIQTGEAHIISTSWGLCELDQSSATQAAEHTEFEQAVATGIGIYDAAGDHGSYDCYGDNGPNDTSLAVDAPANDPNVTAVGGTRLLLNNAGTGYGSESVWNDRGLYPYAWLGGGGGVSQVYAVNSTITPYQQGLNPPGLNGATGRMVPDVSANADPATGYSIYTILPDQSSGWTVIGGTSLATPLWAALMAEADQAAVANGGSPLGFANPTLYKLAEGASASAIFHDVTQGDNDVNPNDSAHLYSAAAGYDLASGWGSPDGAALIGALVAGAGASATATQTAVAASATAAAQETATATALAQQTAAQQTATAVAQQTASQLATAAAQQTAAQQTSAAQTAVAAAQQTSAASTATAAANAVSTATAAAQQTSVAGTAAAQQTIAAGTTTAAAQQTATTSAATAAAQQTSAASTSTAAAQQTATAAARSCCAPTATGTPALRAATALVRHKAARPRPPALVLTIILPSRSVLSGGTLTVGLRTAPHGQMTVTLRVVTTKVQLNGKGRHRRRVVRTLVLYTVTAHGSADGHGRLTSYLRVNYNVDRPVPATLTATVRTQHGTMTRSAGVTIQAPRHRQRQR